MTALVQLESERGPVWVNPLRVISAAAGEHHVYVNLSEDILISIPVPGGATPDSHTRVIVGRINTGLVAEYK